MTDIPNTTSAKQLCTSVFPNKKIVNEAALEGINSDDAVLLNDIINLLALYQDFEEVDFDPLASAYSTYGPLNNALGKVKTFKKQLCLDAFLKTLETSDEISNADRESILPIYKKLDAIRKKLNSYFDKTLSQDNPEVFTFKVKDLIAIETDNKSFAADIPLHIRAKKSLAIAIAQLGAKLSKISKRALEYQPENWVTTLSPKKLQTLIKTRCRPAFIKPKQKGKEPEKPKPENLKLDFNGRFTLGGFQAQFNSGAAAFEMAGGSYGFVLAGNLEYLPANLSLQAAYLHQAFYKFTEEFYLFRNKDLATVTADWQPNDSVDLAALFHYHFLSTREPYYEQPLTPALETFEAQVRANYRPIDNLSLDIQLKTVIGPHMSYQTDSPLKKIIGQLGASYILGKYWIPFLGGLVGSYDDNFTGGGYAGLSVTDVVKGLDINVRGQYLHGNGVAGNLRAFYTGSGWGIGASGSLTHNLSDSLRVRAKATGFYNFTQVWNRPMGLQASFNFDNVDGPNYGSRQIYGLASIYWGGVERRELPFTPYSTKNFTGVEY